MSIKTIVALLIGTAAMWLLISAVFWRTNEKVWKSMPVAFMLTLTGTVGTYIWFFVESSKFGGRSFYGAVFLVPIAFHCVARFMRVSYENLMDACAPSECAMLVIMKYMCLQSGCCGGRFLYMMGEGVPVYFPSQIVELVAALLIMIILLWVIWSKKKTGRIYGLYLMTYGISRFGLNFFREDQTPFLLGLPVGNIWSLVAVFVGAVWFAGYAIKIEKRVQETRCTNEVLCCEGVNETQTE